ncbi:hypothetical protein CcaverHIS002_0602860 [Cutaneotrichosporon cavernicola]|uniref:Copper transport protein n=1 Tax=Cutaneotrichosporon cavernicola TaxID=279322 RepID=A0AA48L8A9_9TREE|nr:uncharacterized protein CcaverHIS019_0602340 [Cutaneotrichosporon cavernicola]BEI85999.1 hypothetical protein CcaverHIS002_0602860 [Cutaneotrichosporon cavernicola]BEI93775.1 hypothetical protein CcaverHIS019_0602340 [Cutaneotrichosporon cavernicola]BEJ01553.1 hypothetical protein CcaverHIS631_0602350 [Cutaneotrichosporon cavernicola]BEJ09317.1 hypothetical protein CcaverHIS641_0602320 [Cutaneotrichosporon cavernicola]
MDHDMSGMSGMASSAMTNMMSMTNMPSATGTAAAAAATGMAAGGHSMGVSMLWNWTTIDACFLSRSWHIKTKAMFAGSIVGVFFLCMLIEGIRRLAREYDRQIIRANRTDKGRVYPPTFAQHVVRTLAYGVQFTGAFLVMLLGMYFNVPMLMAIFFGHTFGYLAFGRDTCGDALVDSGCAC